METIGKIEIFGGKCGPSDVGEWDVLLVDRWMEFGSLIRRSSSSMTSEIHTSFGRYEKALEYLSCLTAVVIKSMYNLFSWKEKKEKNQNKRKENKKKVFIIIDV